MGKVYWPAALLVALLGTGSPAPASPVSAQTSLPPCAASGPVTPMQGHYTGQWHSNAIYHFAVFDTDLILTIVIDGTLDATVSASGRVSGSVTGRVDAPINHDGQQDVSSGYGTISGGLTGIFGSAT